jgi:hypothetical protein
LARDFAAKGHGRGNYYRFPSADVGDAWEFGADYYSGRGRKIANRWYGYVVRVEVANGAGYVVLHECAGGKAAVKAGAKFAATLVTA